MRDILNYISALLSRLVENIVPVVLMGAFGFQLANLIFGANSGFLVFLSFIGTTITFGAGVKAMRNEGFNLKHFRTTKLFYAVIFSSFLYGALSGTAENDDQIKLESAYDISQDLEYEVDKLRRENSDLEDRIGSLESKIDGY